LSSKIERGGWLKQRCVDSEQSTDERSEIRPQSGVAVETTACGVSAAGFLAAG
jgi:hypothetical protein